MSNRAIKGLLPAVAAAGMFLAGMILAGCGVPTDRGVFRRAPVAPGHQTFLLQRGPGVAPAAAGRLTTEQSCSLPGCLVSRPAPDGSGVLQDLFDTRRSPLVEDGDLVAFATNWLEKHRERYGLEAGRLVPAPRFIHQLTSLITSVNFVRLYQEVPVKDSRVEVSFTRTKAGLRLREVRNEAFGRIDDDPEPGGGAWTAAELAHLGDYTAVEILDQQPVVVALRDEAAGRRFSAATIVTFTTGVGPVISWMLGEDPAAADEDLLLMAWSHEVHAGPKLQASVYKKGYARDQTGPVILGNTRTDSGQSSPAGISPAGANRVSLVGRSAIVLDRGREVSLPLTGGAAGMEVEASPDHKSFPALNAYAAVLAANRFIRRHLDAGAVPWLNGRLDVEVNSFGSCNASFAPPRRPGSYGQMRLMAKESSWGREVPGGCPSMALITDVVFHEYGHGLDFATGIKGGIIDGAFSEGIGDILAAYIIGSPEIGLGFKTSDKESGIRSVDNTYRYPDHRGEVHKEGNIISGAFWDLRQELIQIYGEEAGAFRAESYFFRHLLTTDFYTRSYDTLMQLADEDGNPATASADRCAIHRAFDRHGLAGGRSGCSASSPVSAAGGDARSQEDQAGIMAALQDAPSGTRVVAALPLADPYSDRVYYCQGSSDSCAGSRQTAMPYEGSENGRHFFATPGSVSVRNHGDFTILVVTGNKESFRTFRPVGY